MSISRTTRWYDQYRRLPLRDALAAERTVLANERTFLAHVRTAFATFLAGATGVQLLTHDVWTAVAWLFLGLGLVLFGWSLLRYRRVHHELILLLNEHAREEASS